MKTRKILTIFLSIVAVFVTVFSSVNLVTILSDRIGINSIIDPKKATYPMKYNSENSFFEDTNVFSQDRDEWDYINPYFNKYPRTENTSNFQSLATASYANINGRTVTVDTLYRNYNEALNDPNYACGMLMYQCILYKIANPEEDVSLTFTSFRTSVTTAICINPNSPYYGYMISIYDNDYNENGFVRVSYLLVEAARLGINVTIVGQLPSYSVKQYDNTKKATYSAEEPSYISYFNKALTYPCYSKYESGKKVSDFMSFNYTKWDYDDKGGVEVMHLKSVTASHYLDLSGQAHRYGVWLSSTNLDANNYKGYNGNNGSQSGVIITNHKEVYEVTYNYVQLLKNYMGREQVFDFRKKVNERNTKQALLILEGREEEIPQGEQIIYLGSETDNIFEMYFTPFGGNYDTWDLINNPYAKYMQEFYESDDYVVFTMNNPNFANDFIVSELLLDVLNAKFIEQKNVENRLGIRCRYGEFGQLSSLKVGRDIGCLNFNSSWDGVHNKDIIMSYSKNGERQYVSLINSCNFNEGALFFQINSMLVIKETEQTGTLVYHSLGEASTEGVITNDGQTFSPNERYVMENKLTSFPKTIEAEICIDKREDLTSYGIIMSNNNHWDNMFSLEVRIQGNPMIVFGQPTIDEVTGDVIFKRYSYAFTEVFVDTGNKEHIAVTLDLENNEFKCYLNGEFKQAITLSRQFDLDYISANNFVVGGDYRGSSYKHFKGTMHNLAAFSDLRSEEEIANDYEKMCGSSMTSDEELLVCYDMDRIVNSRSNDKSKNNNNFIKKDIWQDITDVEEVGEYDYSFAVIGDTQSIIDKYPDQFGSIYDWIIDNKEEHKIEYAIGLGDITENSTEEEFLLAKEQIYKLSGKVPFSLSVGNHDIYDIKDNGFEIDNRADLMFNKTFYNETYLNELDGYYQEGDVTCSYNAFEVQNHKWLILNLTFGPTDEMIEWAKDVIESHADHRVIITTHAYLYRDGSYLTEGGCYPPSYYNEDFNDGDQLWEKLVSKYENIKLVLCGHDPHDSIVHNQKVGDNGNVVTQVLVNPQHLDNYYQATGMIALFYFSDDGNTLTVRYYSVVKDMYGSKESQFTIQI